MTTPEDIQLVETCSAMPEQYEAYIGTRRVGYLRLRFGRFTVECPDCGGTYVYSHDWDDEWKGRFSDDERETYLAKAKEAICTWLAKH